MALNTTGMLTHSLDRKFCYNLRARNVLNANSIRLKKTGCTYDSTHLPPPVADILLLRLR